MARLLLRGFDIRKGFLNGAAQVELIEKLRPILKSAPLFRPVTPSGKEMSVRMTSAGSLGWVTDKAGYRYQPQHPKGPDWPAIPNPILDIWRDLASPRA